MVDQPEPKHPAEGDDVNASLSADLRLLAEQGKAYAEAELSFQHARATFAGRHIRTISILGISALTLLVFAVMALIFGAVLALTPSLGAWGAMATVAGVIALLALACILSAVRLWRNFRRGLKHT